MCRPFLIAVGLVFCSGCATRQSDPDEARSKIERQFRGVWRSNKFVTNDSEFSNCTNLAVYVYHVGKFQTNGPYIAEVVGAFVYRGQDGREASRYPVQLASDDRIRVGAFMEGIWPHYAFSRGSLILEIEEGSYFYRATLHKIRNDPGDPRRFLPPWVIESQADD
jgi:hypothetical protein